MCRKALSRLCYLRLRQHWMNNRSPSRDRLFPITLYFSIFELRIVSVRCLYNAINVAYCMVWERRDFPERRLINKANSAMGSENKRLSWSIAPKWHTCLPLPVQQSGWEGQKHNFTHRTKKGALNWWWARCNC